MKKDIERILEIPEEVILEIKDGHVTVKKDSKVVERTFNLGKISLVTEGKTLKILAKNGSKREAKMAGTTFAHLSNMIKGLTEGFEYKMEVCSVHFPMNIKQESDHLIIKSFLGEKKDRKAKIVDGAEVKISGNNIIITSLEIEKAGQTATNIEKATRLTGRDRRIFQDGIFIVEKNGRKI
jgi:large subunit ribosomal protein L6